MVGSIPAGNLPEADGAAARLAFPQTTDDLTRDWFSAALAQRYPGTEVTGLTPSTVIRGMATKARFELAYNAAGLAHGLPPSLWVKSGFDALNDELKSHNRTEALFFRDLAPLLPIGLPKSYLELLDTGTSNGLVLLEDLTRRNVRFGRQTEPLTPEEMVQVLALQASYHGALWGDPRLAQSDWLTVGGMIVASNVCDIFLGFWDTAERQPRFDHVPPALRDRSLIRTAIQTMHAVDARAANCVVHGDAHQGNLYFEPDGRPGYLDWASVMRGHWAFDVAYLMIGSQSVENRRALQRHQLGFYLERLAAAGAPAPAFEDAWLAYRQHAIWMFMTTLCPVELHPEDICMNNAERACAAIIDLESLASLGL